MTRHCRSCETCTHTQSKGAGEVQSGVDGGEVVSEEQAREWQERETEAADREFQRELEVCEWLHRTSVQVYGVFHGC